MVSHESGWRLLGKRYGSTDARSPGRETGRPIRDGVLRAGRGQSPGRTHEARERTEARPEQACSWVLPENQQDVDAGAFGRTVSRRSECSALPGGLFWNVPRNGNDSYWSPQIGRWQFFTG